MSSNPFARAETLDRFYETLELRPLLDKTGLNAFYYQQLNKVRGADNVPLLQQELNRSHGGRFFRAFLAGHSGCGKSTELARLSAAVSGKFRTIRFSAKDEMHPSSAKPFDVLILMMIRLAAEISKSTQDGGLAWEPPADITRGVLDWFNIETSKVKTTLDTNASVQAGAGMSGDSLWAKSTGLFAHLKGEVKFASVREDEVINRRVARLPELIDLLNTFFDACNDELRTRHNQEWFFVGEDFEKLLDFNLPATFFVKESAIFSSLRTHLVFTIPIDLAWSAQDVSLPFQVHTIYDTPVYTASYQPDTGRTVLRELLAKRINLDCIATHQLDRFIVASGGHLRDLFSLIKEAADFALLSEPISNTIRDEEATRAIAKLRQTVVLRLGESPYDPAPIAWELRAKRLKNIYEREPKASVPDAILHSLLRARAVQQFNGVGRFAVSPLVVDIFIKQAVLDLNSPGGLLPGN